MTILRTWLAHPLTRGLALDDPRTTQLRRRIIREKSFLRQVYQEWYTAMAGAVPPGPEPILELGSGAGFLSQVIPGLITSDVVLCHDISAVLDAQRLPFAPGVLRGVVMTNVLHHVPQARQLFRDAARCVRPGGVLVMLEPWVSPWSRLIYGWLHHEPFLPDAAEWEFPSGGPLSGANSALPWIVLERDRTRFEREFPEWHISAIQLGMPFRYLLSGGVAWRSLMPGWTFGLWRQIEHALEPWMKTWAMFALIVLVRAEGSG